MKTAKYTLTRTTQSDVALMTELLETISNDIVFADIVEIKPEYIAGGLIIFVTYL